MTKAKIDLVILAGGKGTRIKKISCGLPKPMIKINNKPFLSYIINHASIYNFRKIFIMCGFKSYIIKKKYHNKKINFIPIKCIQETEALGTAGCLSLIKKKLSNEFIMTNGDTFLDIDYKKIIKKQLNNNNILMVLTRKNSLVNSKKLISLDTKNNKVINKNNGKFINAGIYKIKKNFIKRIDKKFLSLEENIFPKQIKLKKVIGYKHSAFFLDIGTPKNFRISHKLIKKTLKKPAAFLDRDGTINYDYGYVHNIKDFRIKPGVIKGMKLLTKKGYYIFIVTNQAGIAKNKFNYTDFEKLHIHLKNKFLENNINVNNVMFCPYHKNAKIKKYKKISLYRKPGNLMIEKLKKNWDIEIKKSFFIGDQKTDYLAAKKSNLKFYYANKNFYELIKTILN